MKQQKKKILKKVCLFLCTLTGKLVLWQCFHIHKHAAIFLNELYVSMNIISRYSRSSGPLLDIIEEANSSICDEFAYQVGDGLCDDNVNIEMCQFDGGDCCLDKKLTPLCKNCTCKMNFDEDVLKADLNRSDVKVFVEMADYNDVLVNEDVMAIDDVESVNVCSSLCFGEASGATTKVNGWSYDYATAKCSCSWLSATLCLVIEEDDMTSIDEGQDSKKLEGSVGFVALSKTLKCGRSLVDLYVINSSQIWNF